LRAWQSKKDYLCARQGETKQERGDLSSFFISGPDLPRMEEIKAKVASALASKLEEPDFSHCFLLEIKISARGKVEVFLDSDTGVDFNICRQISRFLEEFLDQGKWLGDAYTLEVSSPGATRPLVLPRQYAKHVGRRLVLSMPDGSMRKGVLKAVESDQIVLEAEEEVADGKRKRIQILEEIWAFRQIKEAIVEITF